MRFLFYMGHPAHYHNVSVVMKQLKEAGHEIMTVGRQKDVLIDLMADIPYPKKFLPGKKNNSKISLIVTVLKRLWFMIRIAIKFKPDLMVGTDIVITHIGKVLGIKTVILNEDDTDQIPLFTKYGIRYVSAALSPQSCGGEPYEYKTYKYPGYHELAYLHPNYFVPDKSKVEHLFENHEGYSIIRFSALESHHDVGKKGISEDLALKLIEKLKRKGKVYVSAELEKKLPESLETYRINIDPKLIHHALHFASIYIGDSQTMAAEAAVLGTPSIRFNDFVGKLGYLEELEHEFGLTFGIPTEQPERLLEIVEDLVETEQLDSKWAEKRAVMLEKTIDVAQFFAWFFVTFPKEMKNIVVDQELISRFYTTLGTRRTKSLLSLE